MDKATDEDGWHDAWMPAKTGSAGPTAKGSSRRRWILLLVAAVAVVCGLGAAYVWYAFLRVPGCVSEVVLSSEYAMELDLLRDLARNFKDIESRKVEVPFSVNPESPITYAAVYGDGVRGYNRRQVWPPNEFVPLDPNPGNHVGFLMRFPTGDTPVVNVVLCDDDWRRYARYEHLVEGDPEGPKIVVYFDVERFSEQIGR